MSGRRLWVSAALLCVVLALAGCAAARPQPAAREPDRNIIGLWATAATKGKPASLSEIGFSDDGSFRHSGSNALGMPVNFGGRYQVGGSAAHRGARQRGGGRAQARGGAVVSARAG